ncbi:MAG: zf-HC2 domain-containing protein [Acidobacteriota bacterium]
MSLQNTFHEMSCSEVDELLADYVDQSLGDRTASAVKAHLNGCADCRELAQDAASAVAFMDRAAVVDVNPELINRVLFQVSSDPQSVVVKHSFLGRVLGKWFHPRLGLAFQPRFAMSMAMMVLSMGMAVRLEGMWKIQASDLNPVKVWASAESRVTRLWDRSVKFYSNRAVVVKIESQIEQWKAEQDAAPGTTANRDGK